MSGLRECLCGRDHSDPHVLDNSRRIKQWRVRCSSCPASTHYYDTEAEAIAAWNRRAPATVTRDEVAFLVCGNCQCDPMGKCGAYETKNCVRAADAILALLNRGTKP